MNVVDSAMLIKADAGNNNNKFYDIKLYDDGTVEARYGRVGNSGQTKRYSGGRAKFDKIIASKLKPENKRKKGGYKYAQVVTGSGEKVISGNLRDVAKRQIKYANCKETEQLISKLVKWNVHDIAANSTMKVNLSSGQIELPSGMGVLTPAAISEARDILQKIKKTRVKRASHPKKWTEMVNNYLMLVPQKIPSKRGWIDTIYSDDAEVTAQESLLDSLEGTLNVIGDTPDVGKVFDLELAIDNDTKVFSAINNLYNKTRKGMHSSYDLEVSRIFRVNIGYMQDRFDKCPVKNIMELWHGTRVGNLLSILKSGLIIPKHAAHGRAFGNGVYFSDQSTKALNYASGYWDGGYESTCFMFLADVRMGKVYVPTGGYRNRSNLPRSDYDSTWAQVGKSGVSNNEMIVYSLDQINLKYLVEFSR